MWFCLNNQPLFLNVRLNQGYCPYSLPTPPTDLAVQLEMSFSKQGGFNILRKYSILNPLAITTIVTGLA
ncbi:MAG: hypothetical protein K0B06_02525 [Brevefilum sp.]|nr:hypothetical protein [Brevefilum sp.]